VKQPLLTRAPTNGENGSAQQCTRPILDTHRMIDSEMCVSLLPETLRLHCGYERMKRPACSHLRLKQSSVPQTHVTAHRFVLDTVAFPCSNFMGIRCKRRRWLQRSSTAASKMQSVPISLPWCLCSVKVVDRAGACMKKKGEA
jgi:hypothetical protein